MDAQSREERRQMRQRGAGNRATKEFGFGFSFLSPPGQGQSTALARESQSHASNATRTSLPPPQPSLPLPTPQIPRASPRANPSSVRKSPSSSPKAASSRVSPQAGPTGPENPSLPSSSPKRRALGAQLTPVRRTPGPSRRRRPSSRPSSDPSSAFDIPDDDDDNITQPARAGLGASTEELPTTKRRRISSQEASPSIAHVVSDRQAEINEETNAAAAPITPENHAETNTENQGSSPPRTAQSPNQNEGEDNENPSVSVGQIVTKPSDDSGKPAERRKGGQTRRHTKKRPLSERSKGLSRNKPTEIEESDRAVVQPERLSISNSTVSVEPEEENDEIEDDNQTELQATSGRIPKASRRRKPKAHADSDTSESDSDSEGHSAKHRNAVPINVIRFANPSALDYQRGDNEKKRQRHDDHGDSSSSDELAHFDPNPRRPGGSNVSAADVLLQLCSETIDNLLSELVPGDEELDPQQQKQIRTKLLRKRRVLQMFKSSIHSQLFSLQDASDTNAVLSRRLRLAKRETGALRARLVELRREKDKSDIMADQVRSGFLKDEEQVKGWMEVNRATEGLELAMQREKNRHENGKEDDVDPVVGLEFLLKDVAEDVSSIAPSSQGKGLLTTIKDFNSQLERTLAKLEEAQ